MENFSLVKVEWSQHRDRLKEPIERIGKLSNDPLLYTNIDKACSNEWAFLFLAPDGFIVLRPRHQKNATYIEITAASCYGGNAVVRYQPFVVELAKKGGAEFLKFLTVRKGFSKLAPKQGWRQYGKHRQYDIWQYDLRN